MDIPKEGKMPKFAAGVVKFQRDVYPRNAELFERLAKGQSPEALFITCSDSRIELGMLTQSEPGDLFVAPAGSTTDGHRYADAGGSFWKTCFTEMSRCGMTEKTRWSIITLGTTSSSTKNGTKRLHCSNSRMQTSPRTLPG